MSNIWAGELWHYKLIWIRWQVSQGGIRELFTNAANPAVMIVLIIPWWDGKLFLYYPLLPAHPFPSPITPFSQSMNWHSLYPRRNYFSKVHCCFFSVISIPSMRFFPPSVGGQGPLQQHRGRSEACIMILWIWGNYYPTILAAIEQAMRNSYMLHLHIRCMVKILYI